MASYTARARREVTPAGLSGRRRSGHGPNQCIQTGSAAISKAVTVPLPEATADTRILTRRTLRVLRRIYRAGFGYHKAGIAFLDIRPRAHQQFGLFVQDDHAQTRNECLMRALDAVNGRYGRGAIKLAAEGIEKPWQMRRGNLSPKYTTDWDGVAKVSAR